MISKLCQHIVGTCEGELSPFDKLPAHAHALSKLCMNHLFINKTLHGGARGCIYCHYYENKHSSQTGVQFYEVCVYVNISAMRVASSTGLQISSVSRLPCMPCSVKLAIVNHAVRPQLGKRVYAEWALGLEFMGVQPHPVAMMQTLYIEYFAWNRVFYEMQAQARGRVAMHKTRGFLML